MSGDPVTLIVLALVAVIAGAVNAVAGGGTFFSFPVLIWAGLPPLVANATNLVALLPASFAALPAYRKELSEMSRETLTLPLVYAVIGGTAGAILLIWLGNDLFAGAVPYLMGTATALFAFAPRLRRWVATREGGLGLVGGAILLTLFSVYGGYFGAGVGQIMLAALIIVGHEDIRIANALKNLLVGVVTVMAVFVFSASAAVAWGPAAVMFVGAAIGGVLGGALTKVVRPEVLRVGIIVLGVTLTALYFLRGV